MQLKKDRKRENGKTRKRDSRIHTPVEIRQNKRLLSDILRVVKISYGGIGCAKYGILKSLDELTKCLNIAVLRPLDIDAFG